MDMNEIISELQKHADNGEFHAVKETELNYLETRVKMLKLENDRLKAILSGIGIDDIESVSLYKWQQIRQAVKDYLPF